MERVVKLVFDNAGGLIVSLGENIDYVHFYEDMGQAAEDVKAYLRGDDTSSWEENLGKQFFWKENNDTNLTVSNLNDLVEKIEWGNNVKSFYKAIMED